VTSPLTTLLNKHVARQIAKPYVTLTETRGNRMKNLAYAIFLITVLGLSASCFAPLHADEETPPQENFYKKLMLRDSDVITNIDDQPVSDPQQAFQMLNSLRHRDIQISRDQERDEVQSPDQNPAQLEESESDDGSRSPAQE